MASFAPVSTWTPTWHANYRFNYCNLCHSSSRISKSTLPSTSATHFTAVIDNSIDRDSKNNHLSESVHSIHTRLGIQSIWAPDTPPPQKSHHQPRSNSYSSSTSTTTTTTTTAAPIPSSTSSSSSSSTSTPSPSTSTSSSLSLDTSSSSNVTSILDYDSANKDNFDKPPSYSMPWDTTTGGSIHKITLLDRRFQSIRKRQQLLARSYEECRRITALFSKTFYLGTSLLSPEKRRAVWAIYTWCRRTDDIVDGPRVIQRSAGLREALEDWEKRLVDIFAGKARDALDLALSDAVSQFPHISPTPFIDMIKGMLMDVEKDRYDTFDDLYLYCYRVAGTVGLMTLPVMGINNIDDGNEFTQNEPERLRRAVEPAVALGIGLQLTNILRDIGEDRLRGRIYIPLEDLRRFNYTEQDLFNCVLDSRYINLMKFQIARARRFFKQAQQGVKYLSEDSRLPVQASLDMYSQILDVLEDNGYDNFNRRAHISKTRKLVTLPSSYLRTRIDPSWKPVLTTVEFLLGTRRKFLS